MMVSSISSVRFGNTPVDFAREGAHSKTAKPETASAANAAPEKISGGKKLFKTVIGLAVAAGLLVTLHKADVLKVLSPEALEEIKWYNPKLVGHYLSKAGEAIAKVTYDPIVKLFNRAPKADA